MRDVSEIVHSGRECRRDDRNGPGCVAQLVERRRTSSEGLGWRRLWVRIPPHLMNRPNFFHRCLMDLEIQGSPASGHVESGQKERGITVRDDRRLEGGSRWVRTAGGALNTWMATRPENSGSVVRLTTWTAAQE